MDSKIFDLSKILYKYNTDFNTIPIIFNNIDYRLKSYNLINNIDYTFDKDLNLFLDNINLNSFLPEKDGIRSFDNIFESISEKSFVSDLYNVSLYIDNFNILLENISDISYMFCNISNYILSHLNRLLVIYIKDLSYLDLSQFFAKYNPELIVIIVENLLDIKLDLYINSKDILSSLNIFVKDRAQVVLNFTLEDCVNSIIDFNIFLSDFSKFSFNNNHIKSSILSFYNIVLSGCYSFADIKNILKLSSSKYSIFLRQLHKGSYSVSDCKTKSVFFNCSTLLYKAFVDILKDANYSKANQAHKMLILDPSSSYTSLPSLNILNKNVKCSHSSVSSYLNYDHIYYLYSRGINYQICLDILVNAFSII